jgi:6-phosphogluconolactonase
MEPYELLKFPGPEELAREAARQWLAQLAARVPGGGLFSIALSGGRIAARFFAATAELAKAQGIRLGSVQFFWSDERCVPPSDPESNYGLAREHLLGPLGVAEDRIHRVRGEQPPKDAAAQAEAELRSLVAANANGQTLLDLVLLGLGEEGHVASLFPGESAELMNSPAVFRPVTVSKPPPQRITMGYPPIVSARQCWVLASGSGKQGALRESLSPAGRTPLARVLQMRTQTKVWTDVLAGETGQLPGAKDANARQIM